MDPAENGVPSTESVEEEAVPLNGRYPVSAQPWAAHETTKPTFTNHSPSPPPFSRGALWLCFLKGLPAIPR